MPMPTTKEEFVEDTYPKQTQTSYKYNVDPVPCSFGLFTFPTDYRFHFRNLSSKALSNTDDAKLEIRLKNYPLMKAFAELGDNIGSAKIEPMIARCLIDKVRIKPKDESKKRRPSPSNVPKTMDKTFP